jgi:hypothetical protein
VGARKHTLKEHRDKAKKRIIQDVRSQMCSQKEKIGLEGHYLRDESSNAHQKDISLQTHYVRDEDLKAHSKETYW